MKTSPRRVQIWFQNRRATVKRMAKERGEESHAVNFRSIRTPLSATALATLLASENEMQHRYELMRLHGADHAASFEPAAVVGLPTPEPALLFVNADDAVPPPPPRTQLSTLRETAVNLARMSIHSLLSAEHDMDEMSPRPPSPPPPTARGGVPAGEYTYSLALPSIRDLMNNDDDM
jgi:hypothetical protein